MRRLRKVETCEWTFFSVVFAICCLFMVVANDYNPREFSFNVALFISVAVSFIFGYFPGKYTEAPPKTDKK